MIANNWRVCPKCKAQRVKSIRLRKADLQSWYGKIEAVKYEKQLAELSKAESEDLDDTLREDCEIYVDDDGEFSVSYRASCEKCDYEFSFKHSEQTIPKAS